MSKKGPRSAAFNLLTESLSEEIITHYLELAYHVREEELARRREMERGKAAVRRARAAALAAAMEAAARAAGILSAEGPGTGEAGRQDGTRRAGKGGRKSKIEGRRKPRGEVQDRGTSDKPGTPGEVGEGRVTQTELPQGAIAAEAGTAGLPEPAAKASPSKSRNRKPITREDILKLVVADSLGYLGKVRADGWGGLTCAESGRVGGMMTRRMKRLEKGLAVPESRPPDEAR